MEPGDGGQPSPALVHRRGQRCVEAGGNGSLRVYLHAPQAPGSFTLKLALGHRSSDSKFGNPYLHALPVGVAGLSRRTWSGFPLLPLALDFLGAPGCELLAEPLVIVPLTADANGVSSKSVPLPPLLPTDTLTFFLQGAVFAPGANAAQFLFSDAVALKMQ